MTKTMFLKCQVTAQILAVKTNIYWWPSIVRYNQTWLYKQNKTNWYTGTIDPNLFNYPFFSIKKAIFVWHLFSAYGKCLFVAVHFLIFEKEKGYFQPLKRQLQPRKSLKTFQRSENVFTFCFKAPQRSSGNRPNAPPYKKTLDRLCLPLSTILQRLNKMYRWFRLNQRKLSKNIILVHFWPFLRYRA